MGRRWYHNTSIDLPDAVMLAAACYGSGISPLGLSAVTDLLQWTVGLNSSGGVGYSC